jgi:crotonobetainyl-CoA:carnitine CoA-transferase CaiB-like acyl-CoA transferase
MLPLGGVRVIEFAHMVMGPSCGLVLADLGAEVIKIEPLKGDNTRRLEHAGSGFFPVFNRNKKSLAIDLQHPEGNKLVLKLLGTADVLTENFRPGALDKLGFSYARLKEDNPRLIYCSLKGFLNGPYEHRPALDEVTQMMGGLAYMTGLPDRPLRAGSSVVDIMGGTFAAVAILAALRSRESTGRGMQVTSALFESTAYLVAQHMAQFELTGEAPPPMSVKRPAWSVYDIFETAGGGRLFIGVVTDTQWDAFCREFRLDELAADPRLKTNGQRVKERAWLIPRLNQLTREHAQGELAARLEAIGMPFAPIAKPWDLLDDPHLNASGGLLETRARGKTIHVPALPVALDGERLRKRADPPRVGEHARELLASLGCSPQEIESLRDRGIVALPQSSSTTEEEP